jgi:hypothetical protein
MAGESPILISWPQLLLHCTLEPSLGQSVSSQADTDGSPLRGNVGIDWLLIVAYPLIRSDPTVRFIDPPCFPR